MLMKPIELEEVEVAVKQMMNDKALGPDGFTTKFFHDCWHTIKDEILDIVEDSRKNKENFEIFQLGFPLPHPKRKWSRFSR